MNRIIALIGVWLIASLAGYGLGHCFEPSNAAVVVSGLGSFTVALVGTHIVLSR